MLHQCIDSLVQKVQSGVVIHFEKIGPDPPPAGNDGIRSDIEAMLDTDGHEDSLDLVPTRIPSRPQTPTAGTLNFGNMGTAWHNCRKLIYVPRSAQKGFPVGHWPIPENFWPELSASVLVSGKIILKAQSKIKIFNYTHSELKSSPSTTS
jgi:integrator complex subunit 6